jgi:hypothetical protein
MARVLPKGSSLLTPLAVLQGGASAAVTRSVSHWVAHRHLTVAAPVVRAMRHRCSLEIMVESLFPLRSRSEEPEIDKGFGGVKRAWSKTGLLAI